MSSYNYENYGKPWQTWDRKSSQTWHNSPTWSDSGQSSGWNEWPSDTEWHSSQYSKTGTGSYDNDNWNNWHSTTWTAGYPSGSRSQDHSESERNSDHPSCNVNLSTGTGSHDHNHGEAKWTSDYPSRDVNLGTGTGSHDLQSQLQKPQYFAIDTDESDDDEWAIFDPRHQLGGGLWHMAKDEASLLYLKSNLFWNLDTHLVSKDSIETVRQWAWTCNMHKQEHITRAAVLLDVGDVLSDLSNRQLLHLHYDLRSLEMTNVGIYICTRGKDRWRELLTHVGLYEFCRLIDGVLITRYLVRYQEKNPCLDIIHPTRSPFHFLSFRNGDKGDCAQFLQVPCLLIDDKVVNLRQVCAKGCQGSNGLLVKTRRNQHEWRSAPWQTNVSEVEKWPDYVLDWLASLPGSSSSSATFSGATGQ